MDDGITVERRGMSIESVAGVCGVPARKTGFAGLALQLLTFIVSFVLTLLFFFHIGGYAYFTDVVNTINNNETLTLPTMDFDLIATTVSIEKMVVEAHDDAYNLLSEQSELVNTFFETNGSATASAKINHGPFTQIADAQINLFDVDWDLLSILRALCCLYIVICILWLISIVCLALSIKLEILDFVCIDAFFLTIASLFQLALAIPICALLFYHEEADSILYLISGTVGGLLLCFIFGIVALVMVFGWYNYIDYMGGREDTCLCTSTIVRLIKRNKRHSRGTNSTDYSIPEATRHANLPYIDDTPVQQFSNF